MLKENLKVIVGAFQGSSMARENIRQSRMEASDIEARLSDIKARWPDQAGDSDARPIFIFAAGWRTGSTLLQRMLMSDSDIMIWGEPYTRSRLTGTLMDQLRPITQEWPFEYYAGNQFEGDMSDQWVANVYPPFRHLLAAHRAYFSELFEVPSLAMGKRRWGFKEVRLKSEHAIYLKFLYPNAKFIFLYRDPIAAYSSFRGYIKSDYQEWPEKPVMTPLQFGDMWCEMVRDFVRNYEKVGGMLVRYEDLIRDPGVVGVLSDYLQVKLKPIDKLARISGRRPREQGENGREKKYIPVLDRLLLGWSVGRLRAELGYN